MSRVERDIKLLKWMFGVAIAVSLGTFLLQWQVVDRLAAIGAAVTAVHPNSQPSNPRLQVPSRDP
jgi:hypothetical protein